MHVDDIEGQRVPRLAFDRWARILGCARVSRATPSLETIVEIRGDLIMPFSSVRSGIPAARARWDARSKRRGSA
ncbi:MAG: hypothetical protein IPI67_37995 [Myxococcales bacterium]|nr:hypothetical protein [Myxococcales bacterium]